MRDLIQHAPSPHPLLTHGALGVMLTVAFATPAFAQSDDSPSEASVPRGAGGVKLQRAKKATSDKGNKKVSPPQLKQFVKAAYPAEAEAKGIEGNVVLQLDVGKDGRVSRVTVVGSAGHGFDEAAQQAARKFVFVPALRGGKPVAARILYRYSFNLQTKAKPDKTKGSGDKQATPAVVENLTGQVRGSVGDVPLAGAEVTVVDKAGTPRTETTDQQGRWAFRQLAPGKYRVTVKAPGYQPLQVSETISSSEQTQVIYRVPPEGTIEVVVKGTKPAREVTKRTITKREIERIPGTNGDALRSIQNLPGVARAPGLAGILIVRGSAPRDTKVFIEDSGVPLVYHFGGLSSVVPTELVDHLDFYPGNFSARFGRAKGGIVDVGLRSPKDDGHYHGMAQVDLIDARVMLEGPVPFLKNWTFALAGRRSWFDLWLGPVMRAGGAKVTTAPVYYDYQAILETKPGPRSNLRLSFFGSDDQLKFEFADVNEQDPVVSGNLGLHTSFYRGALTYETALTDTTSLKTSTAVGYQGIAFGIGTLHFTQDIQPLVTHRTELSQKIGKRVNLNVGIEGLWARASVDVLSPPPPRQGEPDPGPFGTRPPLALKMTAYAFQPAAYAEAELTPYPRLRLVPGVRLDYTKMTQRWDVSPRFNARYKLIKGFPRTTLKGGVGLFHQPPAYQEAFPPFGSPGLRDPRAVHYGLGVEQDITKQINASIEGFYKQLDQLVSRVPNEQGAFSYQNLGSGYVVGSEVLVKYKPDKHFFGWLAYTLSRAMVCDNPDAPERLASFDQTHILTVLGSYRLGRGWELGARFRLVSGNPDTPIDGSLYNANAGVYTPVYGEPNSVRLGTFHQLDLRADKRWTFDGWKLSTYLDVQNVYYAKNPEGYQYNYNYTEKSIINGLPIIPSLGVRGEF